MACFELIFSFLISNSMDSPCINNEKSTTPKVNASISSFPGKEEDKLKARAMDRLPLNPPQLSNNFAFWLMFFIKPSVA